ncbi:MAG: hypothetical protein Q8R28_00110 [Dehalococcoidia bacterium]|nr:hypothetical protein [Dehalococcoidia bacterium]
MKPVCVFYYGGWSSSGRDRIIATKPEFLVLNESAGSYGGGPSSSDVALVQAGGTKVFAYIFCGGMRGFLWDPSDTSAPSSSRSAVRGFIARVAAAGYAGIFFDEGGLYSPVSGQTYQNSILDRYLTSPGGITGNARYDKAMGDTWAGYTVEDYIGYARSLGLLVCEGMDSNNPNNVKENIWPIVDFVLTQEKYSGAAPAGVEIAHKAQCWVLSYAGSYSATNTNKALAFGFRAAYNCQSMGALPSPAYENYMAAIVGGTPPPPPPPPPPTTTHTLAVTVQGAGSTTPPVGSYEIPDGQVVTMTAIPAAGWEFRTWSWPGNPDPDYAGWTENPTFWAMDEPISIVAVFDPLTSPPPPPSTAGVGGLIGAVIALVTVLGLILSRKR